MSTDECGGDVKGDGGSVCDPPFAGPRTGNRIVGNDAARFLSKVEQTEGCWLWRGGTFADGRPQFGAGTRTWLAHRWLYEQTIGPIPAGFGLSAACGNPLCVRPGSGHRVPMSAADRVQASWDRHPATHCDRGHEFTAANTRVRVDGSRLCRTCQRSREAADYLAKKKRR